MIPPHFLYHHPPSTEKSDDHGKLVSLTIKQPDPHLNGIVFPEAPTALGKVTETITKSTLTETVVTRVTENKLAKPVPIKVCYLSSRLSSLPHSQYLFESAHSNLSLLSFKRLLSSLSSLTLLNSPSPETKTCQFALYKSLGHQCLII